MQIETDVDLLITKEIAVPPMSQQVIDGSVATVGTAKNSLERILSIVADVQSGEGLGVLLSTIDMVVLLGSYYLLKAVHESLILTEGGAEIRSIRRLGRRYSCCCMAELRHT